MSEHETELIITVLNTLPNIMMVVLLFFLVGCSFYAGIKMLKNEHEEKLAKDAE